MRKKFLLHIIFVALAFAAVWITAYQKTEVFNKDDLHTLSCGWPLSFIASNQSWRDPPFPRDILCFAGEWGDPIEFYWLQFIIDVLMFYAIIVFLWIVCVALGNKMQRQ